MDTKQSTKSEKVATGLLWRFLVAFFAIFFIAASFLFLIDFVPEKPKATDTIEKDVPLPIAEIVDVNRIAASPRTEVEATVIVHAPVATLASSGAGEIPVRIVVPSVGVDTAVVNPVNGDIATLDNALLKGAIRYPGSSTLSGTGDMMLLGHQSYLPVVRNKAFKAFNDLQKLEEGDEITVYSDSASYLYRVRSVELAQASDGKVALRQGINGLVLVTCNSLGAKEDRYIISADLIARTPLT